MMRNIIYPTMNALDFMKIRSYNAGYNSPINQNFGYQATDIPVPIATECPCCNRVQANDLIPIIAVNNLLRANSIEKDEENIQTESECNVVAIYRCTSCNSLFSLWSKHKVVDKESRNVEWTCDVQSIFPFDAKNTGFSDEVSKLSANFVLVYNQAEYAEAHGLSEICGMGYRRALEYLIDDYIRKIKPTETIDSSLGLDKKIKSYIDNQKIKTLAQKSAWLGNDATHIVNKHPDRNIIYDMKKFIRAMVSMIDAEFAYEDADSIEKN